MLGLFAILVFGAAVALLALGGPLERGHLAATGGELFVLLLFLAADLEGTTPWYGSFIHTSGNAAHIELVDDRCTGKAACVLVCPRRVGRALYDACATADLDKRITSELVLRGHSTEATAPLLETMAYLPRAQGGPTTTHCTSLTLQSPSTTMFSISGSAVDRRATSLQSSETRLS